MALHEPSLGITWKYRKTDGILKIVATIYIEVVPDQENVTHDPGELNERNIVIVCTITTESPHSPSVIVKIEEEVDVENIGTGKAQSFVESKIISWSPINVVVPCYDGGKWVSQASGQGSQNSKLDYA